MIYGARFVIVTAFVLGPMTQLRAQEKEPFAVIELGAATERSIQEGTYSAGPSASVEFPVIKDWLEIETGISSLFRPGQTEWQADLLFKKPFTINEHVEFMIGAGPQLSLRNCGRRNADCKRDSPGVDDLAFSRPQVWLVCRAHL